MGSSLVGACSREYDIHSKKMQNNTAWRLQKRKEITTPSFCWRKMEKGKGKRNSNKDIKRLDLGHLSNIFVTNLWEIKGLNFDSTMHSQCSKEHYDKIEPLCIVFSLAGMCGVANVKLNSVFITLHQYLTQHLYGWIWYSYF